MRKFVVTLFILVFVLAIPSTSFGKRGRERSPSPTPNQPSPTKVVPTSTPFPTETPYPTEAPLPTETKVTPRTSLLPTKKESQKQTTPNITLEEIFVGSTILALVYIVYRLLQKS